MLTVTISHREGVLRHRLFVQGAVCLKDLGIPEPAECIADSQPPGASDKRTVPKTVKSRQMLPGSEN